MRFSVTYRIHAEILCAVALPGHVADEIIGRIEVP